MTGSALQDNSRMIAFAGDWHGNSAGVAEKMRQLSRAGVTRLHHAGDFALWPDRSGRRFLDEVNRFAEDSGVPITVTPGNHEDWRYLTAAFAAAGDWPAVIRTHIVALPRGYRWAHRGRSFASFGGAASVDFEYRTTGSSWWAAELPTLDEVAGIAAGGHAEIMITHDAPAPGTPQVDRIRANPNGWSADAVAYAELSATRITAAWAAVAPDLLVHGHFHLRDQITFPSRQRIVSLAAEENPGNVLLLDLQTIATTWVGGPQ